MRTNGHRPKGKVNLSNSRIYNAFALTASACQYIFCEQVVRVNQEQVPFLVMKAPFMQSFALAIAKLCVGCCKALRRQMQCFA